MQEYCKDILDQSSVIRRELTFSMQELQGYTESSCAIRRERGLVFTS